jgi:hypothetical protein
MNKTAVKETVRERGPHMRRRDSTSAIAVTFPLPGPQNCLQGGSFTATGTLDPSQIISIEVELIVSVVNNTGHTTRLIKGNATINAMTGVDWTCPFATTDYPLPGDNYMPAVLIVRGKTTVGGTTIVYVPFSHDPAA